MENDEKLHRLLALKRFENPPPGSLDGVVTEFHRRLRYEEVRRAQNAPSVLWARLMDALLVEPLTLLRQATVGAAMAAGIMFGLGTVTMQFSQSGTSPIPTIAQSDLRIDLESADDAAIRSLSTPEAMPLGALADPDFGRQFARPMIPDVQATPVSFDEANIIF